MAKFSEVEDSLKFLVKSGGIYDVSKDGYVIHRKGDDDDENDQDEDHVMIPEGTIRRPLMILKEQIVDKEAIILNPFNENITESNDGRWFYIMLSVGLSWRIIEFFRYLRQVLELGNEPNFEVNVEMTKFASKYKDFSEKELDHLLTISKNKLEFINIWYNRKNRKAVFYCGIYEESFWEKYPGITKKARRMITDIISEMLGISNEPEKALEEIKEFSVMSESLKVPRLDSVLKSLMKIYTKINPYLEMRITTDEEYVVDLTALGHVISNLEEYQDKCQWFAHQSSIDCKEKVTSKNAGSSIVPSTFKLQDDANSCGVPDNPNRPGPFGGSNFQPQPQFVNSTHDCGVPDNPMRSGGRGPVGYTPNLEYANSQPQMHAMQPMGGNLPFGQPMMNFGRPMSMSTIPIQPVFPTVRW